MSALKWGLTVLLVALWSRPVSASSVSLVGGGSLSNAVFTPAVGFTTSSHSLALGGGVVVDYRLAKKLELEVAFLYLPRGYAKQAFGQPAAETTLTTFQGSVVIKTRLLPFFSLGAGGYYARGLGAVSTSSTAGVTTEDLGLTIKADDYGLVAAMVVDIRIIPYLDIVMHGRYLLGMQNASAAAGTTLTLNDLQVLAGLRFNL